jgi:hypothetical protein
MMLAGTTKLKSRAILSELLWAKSRFGWTHLTIFGTRQDFSMLKATSDAGSVLNLKQRRLARISWRLLCKQIPITQKHFKHLPRCECHNSGLMTPSNVLSKHGRHGRTLKQVSCQVTVQSTLSSMARRSKAATDTKSPGSRSTLPRVGAIYPCIARSSRNHVL